MNTSLPQREKSEHSSFATVLSTHHRASCLHRNHQPFSTTRVRGTKDIGSKQSCAHRHAQGWFLDRSDSVNLAAR
ncbi:hypothetical protein L210DRAFT_951657 [Boletus edulis BED1]|uniref:Uncharacterized protein n=1 Tax=Boletus edulis BED1 TaxID=1328754 RepID=A0AAD4GCN9_BOLED|nr:hypothetical protein L210DRAFT_951657 [Boletus edulis BED1]